MGSTWCRFMRDVQKGATLLTGETGGVPGLARIFLAGVQRAASHSDGVNEVVSPSFLINSPSRKGRGQGMVRNPVK